MRGSAPADVGLRADGLRFALVVARTNAFVTERLLAGAREALLRAGAGEDDLLVARVPGALELPAVARTLARGRYHAIVCLGAVIRGGTPHFEYVSAESVRGVGQVALEAEERGVAITMGILTCDTAEQALERAGADGNKGAEAALAALELCHLRRALAAGPRPRARTVGAARRGGRRRP